MRSNSHNRVVASPKPGRGIDMTPNMIAEEDEEEMGHRASDKDINFRASNE